MMRGGRLAAGAAICRSGSYVNALVLFQFRTNSENNHATSVALLCPPAD